MSFYKNLEHTTRDNNSYRRVIYTTPNLQLVLMTLKPGEDIPRERHVHTTQFIRVEQGIGEIKVGNKLFKLKKNSAIIIPPGIWHYVKNTSRINLKLYTIYSPPEHPKTLEQTHQL